MPSYSTAATFLKEGGTAMTTMLSQIRLQYLLPTLLRVTVKQNNFIAGEIDTSGRVFYSIPRSAKNLFLLFGKPGLGLDSDLLHLDSFDLIKIRYNESILTTSRFKWLSKGIVSPYCDQRVDKQIILKLSDINFIDADEYEPAEIRQEELFSSGGKL